MRVYVHGNCQAPALARLMSERCPEWEITSYEVFGKEIIDGIDRFHNVVQTADVIISQPIHDGYRKREDLALSWLRASAKQSAQIIVIPSMFFDGQLVGSRSTSIPAYGMDYHDALMVHFAVAGVEPAVSNGILLDDNLYSEQFIQREIDLSLTEMRRREQVDGIDVPLSPFVERYAFTTQLFHAINHPCRPALSYIATAVLRCLGYKGEISAIGKDYLSFPHIPCLPSIARFLQLNGMGPSGWEIDDVCSYHLPTQKLAPADYFFRASEHLKRFSNAELLGCLNERHNVRTFLERVAVDNPSLPNIAMWLPPAK